MISFFDSNFEENNYSLFSMEEKEHEQYHPFFYEEERQNNYQYLNESIMGQENHLSEMNPQENTQMNPKIPSVSFDPLYFIISKTGPTEQTTSNLLNQKKSREKENLLEEEIYEKKERIIEFKEEKKEKKEKKIEKKNIKKDKLTGRRKKNEKHVKEAAHNKFTEDNIMRKIKTFVFRYILKILNESLIDENDRFYPLDTNLTKNLKKDFNEELLNRTLFDLFMNSDLNARYAKENNSNKILIEKIKENNEEKTISILNMTYHDILDQIRDNDLQYFLHSIKEKENKNSAKYIDLYMRALKDLLKDYEIWFNKKKGRNSSKRNKSN